MGVEIKGVVCPQCGSHDVRILSDENGFCNSCESNFVIKAVPEIVVGNTVKNDKPSIPVYKRESEYTKDDFIRKCWISVLNCNTPLDLFTSADFTEPEEIERIVFEFWGNATVSYSGRSGNDRREPYIEMEKYREKVGEEYVTKERPVTKYRTVTDWTPVTGKTKLTNIFAVDKRDNHDDFDIDFYKKSLRLRHAGLSVYTGELTTAHIVTKSDIEFAKGVLKLEAEYGHYFNARSYIPGDRVESVKLVAEESEFEGGHVSVTSEYITHLTYKGKEHRANAYPVCDMIINGFSIKDENNPVKAEENRLWEKKKFICWEETKKPLLLSVAALIASILVSIFIRQYVIDFAVLAAAIASYIFSRKHYNKVDAELDEMYKQECEDLYESHKKSLFEALNRKLSSLGYKEATYDEIEWGEFRK